MESTAVGINGILDWPADRFEASDADIDSLAICMLASARDETFRQAKALWDRYDVNCRSQLLGMARAAFGHAGYLPSIVSARRDAVRQHRFEFSDDLVTERDAAVRRAHDADTLWHASAEKIDQLVSERDTLKEQVVFWEDKYETGKALHTRLFDELVTAADGERDRLLAEIMELRDELARRSKPAEVVAVETRDQALVRVTRPR